MTCRWTLALAFCCLPLLAGAQDAHSEFRELDALRRSLDAAADAEQRASALATLRAKLDAFLARHDAAADQDASLCPEVARAHYWRAVFFADADLPAAERSLRRAKSLLARHLQRRRDDRLATLLRQQVALLGARLAARSAEAASAAARAALVGKKAPPFVAEEVLGDREGEGFRLFDQRGKVVLLCFWATFNGRSCRQAIPLVASLRKKHPDLVAVAATRFYGKAYLPAKDLRSGEFRRDLSASEEREVVRRCAEALGIDFPIAFAEKAARAYRVTVLPQLVLVDAQGVVRAVRAGGVGDRASLEELVARCLAEAR